MSNKVPHADVPPARPMIANGAWSAALGEHSRLLGPRAFLKELAKTKAAQYATLKSLAREQWLERTGHTHVGTNDLLAAGIVHAVEGLPREKAQPFIDAAMDFVAKGPTNQHQDSWVRMEQVVLTFDLFHDMLTPQQAAGMIGFLNEQFYFFTDDECGFHNSTASKMHCYLRVAYGTWGDNPMAGVFRDYAVKRLYESGLVPVFREFGAGGGWTECGWYCRHSLWHLVQGLELARRFDGYDGYQKIPAFFYNRLAYELHQPFPGLWKYGAERYACEGDGQYVYSEFNEFPRLMRTVIAQYFRGSELARMTAGRRGEGASHHIRLLDFLYEEPVEKPLDPAAAGMDLAHLAGGIGKVYARSDWSADASWLRFECGPWWNQHQHSEAGHFDIFRREPLATESGEYCDWNAPHAMNWLVRSIAHNCILIHQEGERWHHHRNPDGQEMANDGGQGNRSIVTMAVDAWRRYAEDLQRGRIAAYRSEPEFMYVAGDATAAYARAKARLVMRQIVFIRPHVFVIFDQVVSTRPEYEKTWLLHCQNEPAIDGNRVRIANGAGELHVQTLLPESARIEKVFGYTYGGQTYEPLHPFEPADLVPKWRIEVKPSTPAEKDFFLHVLSTDGPVEAKLVQETGVVGASGDGWRVSFKGDCGGTLEIAGKTFELKGKVIPGRFDT
jgi:hypothetical protein